MSFTINLIAAESESFLAEIYDKVVFNSGNPTGAPLQTLALGANTAPVGDHVILITALDGSEIPNVVNVPAGPGYDPRTFIKETGSENWVFGSYKYSQISSGTNFEITVTAIGGSSTVSPSNKIHWVTPDDIKTLYTKDLYTIISGGQNNVEVSAVEYIIQLMKFPFEVPVDSIGDNLDITLGSYPTNINTPLINTDIIPIDFGSIVVPAPENSLDYESVKYFLQVPKVEGEIELDVSDISGETISIKGLFDVYNGDLTINVYNSNPEPFLSVKKGLGREIPIINRKEKVIGSLGAQIGNDNELLKARIVKEYPEIITGEQNNLIDLSGDLTGLSGYVEVYKIQMDFKAIGQDKQEIETILNQGVYIR